MITIENTEVVGWESAIRGARNPMNSWAKSDTVFEEHECECYPHNVVKAFDKIGPNDLDLMKRLCKAGTDHRKFMRMIAVYCDITAPLYWVAEHDTYKVGTTRNSCSFMHKGVSKPFTIKDFSIQDKRIPYLLSPLEKKEYELVYPYETDEFKYFELENGRRYKVYKNGRVFSCEFEYTDNYGTGRHRTFPEREVKPSRTKGGYFEAHLGGGSGSTWAIHRLVALLWCERPEGADTVNHKNGNKGDNSAENLEWMSRADNIRDGFSKGLYDENQLHRAYITWKNMHTITSPIVKYQILIDKEKGMSTPEIANKYNLQKKAVERILFSKKSENTELFIQAYYWEKLIEDLNDLREQYLETKDISIFKAIRQLLPQGYNVRYTWQANYEVLSNIYHARKNHKLDEWHDFCDWIETLPYSELITGDFEKKGEEN